jgi:hypothetical protein
MINRAFIFTLPNLILTIPIDTRHCFTQRFSPTGFIPNALDSKLLSPKRFGSHSG